jgi:hypothetical protein
VLALSLTGSDPERKSSSSSLVRASAADCLRKSVFTRFAQAGDSGPQASPELFSSTLDAPTLLLKVGATIIARLANLGELSKPH